MPEYVQLTHTGAEVDAAIDAVKTKAEQTALEAESTAREAADTALGKRIDAKADDSALETETAAREAADTALEGAISAKTGLSYIHLTAGGYIVTNQDSVKIGEVIKNSAYAYAVIPCKGGDGFTVAGYGGGSARLWCFVDSDGNSIDKAAASASSDGLPLTAPAGAAYLVVNSSANLGESWILDGITSKGLGGKVSVLESASGIANIDFVDGTYILTPSAGSKADLTRKSYNISTSALVHCYKGQRFIVSGTSAGNSGRSPWMFVGENGIVAERHLDTVSTEYTEHEIIAPVDGSLVLNFSYGEGFACSARTGYKDIAEQTAKNALDVSALQSCADSPLTSLPQYMLNSLAYKPLGALDKGYFCVMTDDGRENGTLGVVSYTIPMAIAKGIPVTFALMHDSDVFLNESWIAAVRDAVENHGCSIAQHGTPRFTTYTEKGLANYFASEKAFFAEHGLTNVEGAVCPAHIINKLVMAVAGGTLGVVRSGYSGGTAEDKARYNGIDLDKFYDYYTSGANSNLYGLSSFNIAAKSLSYSKAAIDYAAANNKILICLYHENEADIPSDDVKVKIESAIDYAISKGLKFITFGDIARLPIANPDTH